MKTNNYILLESNEEFTINRTLILQLSRRLGDLFYSFDGLKWALLVSDVKCIEKKMYLRGKGSDSTRQFSIESDSTCRIKVSGNIESLLDYEMVERGEHPLMGKYAFDSLFRGTCISDASELVLPATKLSQSAIEGCLKIANGLKQHRNYRRRNSQRAVTVICLTDAHL